MACVHLNQLYQLCKESQVRLSSTDLIHLVCKQCQKEEVCPSVLYEEYDEAHSAPAATTADGDSQPEMDRKR
jgi:hypothetical protein